VAHAGLEGLNYPIYDVTHKKNKTQNLTTFSLQTSRLVEFFKGSNSSLAQSTGKLWSCKN